MSQTLLEMTKDLVLAQIEAHRLSPEDMQTALQHTYTSLLALQAQEDAHGLVAVATPETPTAPVNWRKSITKDTVTCLECGASFKQLSVRHLREHGLDLYSALCTEGSVCSGLSMAFAVYRHRSPVCATAAMDMGSPRGALNHADDELGVTR